MDSRSRLLLAVGCASMTWSSVGLAEVMDKEAVPWSPARLLSTLLATGICALLMGLARARRSSRRWALIIIATTIAIAWAVAGAFDDFYSPEVGPAMRAELGRRAAAYPVALLLESAAPILAVVALASGSLTSSRTRDVGPPR